MSDTERKAELISKVTALVAAKFGGDWRRCFNAYAQHGDQMGEGAVYDLLWEADVGNRITRMAYVRGLIEAVDADGDARVTFDEFLAATTNPEGNP